MSRAVLNHRVLPLCLLAGLAGLLPGLAVAQTSAATAAPAAAEPAFDIWAYEVEGNTVLPVSAIEQAVQAHLGPGRRMRDVEAARAALETAYQQAGYLTVLVDIPEQRVDEGVVRLSVLEGRLGQLWVTGSRFHSQGHIRTALPALQVGEVPNFNEVQAQLATVNRSESRRVQPVVKPGRLPGTVDLDLQVTDALPLSGSVELTNHAAAGTSPFRLSATTRYDNLFQRDHGLSLTLQTAPQSPEETRVAVLNYTVPLPEGDAWAWSYTLSNSNVATLGGTQALGNGHTFGLRRHINVSRGGWAGTVSLGADLKRLRDTIAASDSQLETPLRYLPFQLAFNGQWSEGAESLQLGSTLNLAWGRLLQRELLCADTAVQDQFDCKTQGASGSFGVFRLDGRWTRPAWFGSSFSTRLAAQLASGPLVSAEQFTLGGADTVRGYYESEVSADHALLGSFEWRGPNFAPLIGTGWTEVKPLLFADVARGYLDQPLSGQALHSSLWSTGLGMRVAGPGLDAGLDVAWPHKSSTNTVAHSPRVHMRVQVRY